MYGCVLVLSAYTTKRMVDYFVSPQASEITDPTFEKKMKIGKNFVSEGIYKNKQEIEDEFQSLKALTP